MESVSPPRPFADFLSVTVPEERFEYCLNELRDVVGACGAANESAGLLRFDGDRGTPPGTFKFAVRHRVGFFGISGGGLAALRAYGAGYDMMAEYLGVLAEGAHNVTRLDVALDVPVDAAPVVQGLYRRARAGGFHLTRKAIAAHQVRRIVGQSIAGGRDTGTVYLGQRGKRDVIARVYDKRQQILQAVLDAHRGAASADLIALNDPGPLTRYELELGRKVGATLRDAYEPEAVFWHFAGDDLVPSDTRRPGVPDWRAHGTGFTVPRSAVPDTSRQLQLLLETSADVRRAVMLAERLGPYGRDDLARRLRKLYVNVLALSATDGAQRI